MEKPICINMLRESETERQRANLSPIFYIIIGACMHIVHVCSEHCFQVSAAEILGSRGFPTFEVSFDCTINGLSKVRCK